MSCQSVCVPVGVLGKLLAVFCLLTFYLVPFSPFVSLAAVTATRRSMGWPRSLARTGAVLCTVWTLLLAAPLLWLAALRVLNGSWAF